MAIKTVEYWFPNLNTLPNNTLTNLSQITVYLPEDTKVFVSCYVEVMLGDTATTVGNITTKNMNLRVGAAGYTAAAWTQTMTNSGENISFFMLGDFTSHFTSNWSGTSMTCDLQMQVAAAGTQSDGLHNVAAKLVITYEYDSASDTHVKTVRIPLTTILLELPTAKPGTAQGTIPALDTFLPEASKTYRQIAIVIEGNDHSGTATTDITLNYQIDTLTAGASAYIEKALASNRYTRVSWIPPAFTTNATHDFFLWANVAAFNHPMVYMVVTYEFDPATSTRVMNSLLLNMEWSSPVGLSTTTFSHAERTLWVPEPGTITVVNSALYIFYQSNASPGNTNARINPSATWVQSTPNTSVLCGSTVLVRDASALTLTRGRNVIGADLRSASAAALVTNVSSLWMLNYTSDNGGVHTHNQTLLFAVLPTTNQTAALTLTSPDFSVPAGDAFRTGIGLNILYTTNTTGNNAGVSLEAQLRSGATHLGYTSLYADIATDDPEVGTRLVFAQARDTFRRWTDDPDTSRLPLTDARKFRFSLANAASGFAALVFSLTQHTTTFAIGGSILNGPSGNANAKTLRIYHPILGLVREIAISGGVSSLSGVFWYDDVQEVSLILIDDVTGDVACAQGLAGVDTFDLDFGGGGGGSTESGAGYVG